MAASYQLSVIVVVAFVLIVSQLGASKKCSDKQNVFDWTRDSCIYVADRPTETSWKPKRPVPFEALEQCLKFKHIGESEEVYWILPRMNSIEKQRSLFEIMKRIEPNGTQFWIGLQRSMENVSFDQWSDPTQWFWEYWINESLKDSFGDDQPPWAKNQPDNAKYLIEPTPGKLESCVIAKTSPLAKSPWFEWFDEPCVRDPKGDQSRDTKSEMPYRLLCEGVKISNPTPPMVKTNDKSLTTQSPEDDNSALWIGLGSTFCILVVVAIIIVGVCVIKRRRGAGKKKKRRNDSSSSSSRSRGSCKSSIRHPPKDRLKKKLTKKNVRTKMMVKSMT